MRICRSSGRSCSPVDFRRSPERACGTVACSLARQCAGARPRREGRCRASLCRCADQGRDRRSRPASSNTPISSPRPAMRMRVGDRIEVIACTQTPVMDRDEIAHIMGLERGAVRVIPTATGGGFGGKLDLSVQPLVALAAWKLRQAGALHLYAARIADGDNQAPSFADTRARRGAMREGTPGCASISPAISIPAPMPPGDRRSPIACRSMRRAPITCRMCGL